MDTVINAAAAAENRPVYGVHIGQRTLYKLELIGGLTKIRMPSASFCQRFADFLSSSSVIFTYILKRGHEPSEKLDCSCDD